MVARRIQNISLSDSYYLALKIAAIYVNGDQSLLRLQDVTRTILAILEKEGSEKNQLGLEPAYHNRQHFADAVLAMGYFLREIPQLDAYEKQLLLLVMLLHDFGHRGIAHQIPNLSHEDETIQLFNLNTIPLNLLPLEDVSFIRECVLGTKPQQVNAIAREYQLHPQDALIFKKALVNDADIAASFISPIDAELSKLILLEKGVAAPTIKEIEEILSSFKAATQITTGVAREALGLEARD